MKTQGTYYSPIIIEEQLCLFWTCFSYKDNVMDSISSFSLVPLDSPVLNL